ncbi:MAG: DUF1254 domain-containing protein [Bauldia sp.]|nr:DUF1254 domain-containing protein [Bauldia sp.]
MVRAVLKTSIKPTVVGVLAALLGVSTLPAEARMSDIARESAVQRACQAAIWAMPAVSTWDIAQGIINDLGGKVGDLVQLSQPMTSQHGFLTANDVTPYSVAALTTADGPLVVEVPPATAKVNLFGTFVDAWMRPVADVGERGTDKRAGGKYLFLPVGYDGPVPAEGYYVFQLDGYSINFAFRPVSRGDGTIADAVDHVRKNLRVYPLADADTPPDTVFLDASGRKWDTLPYYDLSYFRDIWNFVQGEPIRERDKAMYGVLRAIGIEKGVPFAPSEEWIAIYEDGAKCAFDYMQDRWLTPNVMLVPFNGDKNHWQQPNVPPDQAAKGFPFEDRGIPLIDARVDAYFWATYFPVVLGGSSFYLMSLRDSDGELLNGEDTYRLTVPKDTPAADFWSAIAYSMVTKGFIRDAERVGLSSRELDKLAVNADGSVDLYFAPKAPEGHESNWVPTGEDWFSIFRFYGPEKELFDKSFVLPDFERVE